jgi:hypothetical protein
MAGHLRILLELLAQPCYVDVNRSGANELLALPNACEQPVPGDYLSAVIDEVAQQGAHAGGVPLSRRAFAR